MSNQTCQTCYSELSSSSVRPIYCTPCCNSPICDRCLSRNPRLKEYDPCLRCGDVRSASGSSRIRIGTEAAKRRREEEESGQFAIGDDEDEDDQTDAAVSQKASRPPSYKELDGSSGNAWDDPERQPQANGNEAGASGEEAEIEMEVAEIAHPVGRGDTLMSIARRYASDPHDLLALNNLPPSAMNTNPRIIQTRRYLIIARRMVPKGCIPPTLPLAESSLSPEEAEKREAERRLKRFQLLTKTTDPGVGKAYLALAEDTDDAHVLDTGSGEMLNGESGKKKVKEGKAGREERALEQYYEDEEWEGEVGRAQRVKDGARWTVVGRGVTSAVGLKA